MAKGFNLVELLNEKSKINKENVEPTVSISDFKLKHINIEDIQPSKSNFYSVKVLENIKQSIELLGIEQNLVVEEIPGMTKYKLIAGHRRYFASIMLIEEGKEKFKTLPCKIKNNTDDKINKLSMIMTNSTARELSDYEKMYQTIEVEEIILELKKENNIPGRTRDLLSEILNISSAQLGRYKAIKNNLIPEMIEEFKEGNINYNVAYKTQGLSEKSQNEVYNILRQEGTVNSNDVDYIKQKEDYIKPIPGQITIEALPEEVKANATVNNISDKEYDKWINETTGEVVEEKREGEIVGNIMQKEEGDTSNVSTQCEEVVKEVNEDPINIEAEDNKNKLEIIENKEQVLIKNECGFCRGNNLVISTEDEAIDMMYDNIINKVALINKQTGEIHNINLIRCPVCGSRL